MKGVIIMTRREIRHYFKSAVEAHAHWRNRLNHTDSNLDLLNASYQQGVAEALGKVLGLTDKELSDMFEYTVRVEESKPFTL
jgi:hypothetical protein